MGRARRGKDTKSKKGLVGVIVLLLLIAAAVTAGVLFLGNGEAEYENGAEAEEYVPGEVRIFSGDDRPIAVVIDNDTRAWPHSGIEQAYVVYEMLVEAGETRLLAMFKGVDADVIGPTRSARHYFLDYVLEHDAMLVHFGGSPQALSQISSLGIDNINGIVHESGRARDNTNRFWRQAGKPAPHNAYINTEKILGIAESSGFRTTSDRGSVLNYVTHEVLLEEGMPANTVTIPYSSSNIVRYEFDSENGVFVRYSKNRRMTIGNTDEALTVKNIIILFARNTPIGDGSGRQQINLVGTLDGYYITNGRAIRIQGEKASREAQTIFRDLEGNEIEVNDGNTFIQIVPIDANVEII